MDGAHRTQDTEDTEDTHCRANDTHTIQRAVRAMRSVCSVFKQRGKAAESVLAMHVYYDSFGFAAPQWTAGTMMDGGRESEYPISVLEQVLGCCVGGWTTLTNRKSCV